MLKMTGQEFPELGFMIIKHKWGNGFASEVSQQILKYAFEELNYEKVIASTVLKNVASICVLEKLGMIKSKISDEKDVCYYELSKDGVKQIF